MLSAKNIFMLIPIENKNTPKKIFSKLAKIFFFICGINDFGSTIGPAINCGNR